MYSVNKKKRNITSMIVNGIVPKTNNHVRYIGKQNISHYVFMAKFSSLRMRAFNCYVSCNTGRVIMNCTPASC